MSQSTQQWNENVAEILANAGPSLSYTEAAELLGSSAEDVYESAKQGQILVVSHQSLPIIPGIQFTGNQVLKGVPEVIKAFEDAHAGKWSALQFLTTPDGNLAGRTPIAILKDNADNTIPQVIHAANAFLDI